MEMLYPIRIDPANNHFEPIQETRLARGLYDSEERHTIASRGRRRIYL